MPTEKFEKAATEAFNGGGYLSKIIRYVIIFGWVAAAALFWLGAHQIITKMETMERTITSLCIDIGAIKEWKAGRAGLHEKLDRRLNRLEDKGDAR